ncbi:MAG: acyl-CoA/acyl-ACP dehydrogenase [Actinobacteria bacterium]|nr:acyl-CoA/acyl-ACP dehydrogenase [Actinomycetota bacterium]
MKYQELFPIPVEWIEEVDESIVATVGGWAEREVVSGRLEHREDYDAFLLPAIRKLFVDIGCQAMPWPEKSGGGGLSSPGAAVTFAVVLEQVSSADTGTGFLLANTFSLQSAFGVEPHRDGKLLDDLAPVFCGDREAVCSLVLPAYGDGSGDKGFHGLDYQVAATQKNGQWVMDAKAARPQCSGATARFLGVAFGLEDGAPAVALVPSDTAGLSAGEPFKKTGLAASINADLEFNSVPVPEKHIVLTGADRYRELLSWYYMCCSAVCSGAMLTSYEILKEWGDTRVIKGKGQVFKENPLVAALMGEIGGRTATSRILTYDLARMLSRPDVYGPAGGQAIYATATAVFKQVSRAVMLSINNAMELMASAGYATEWNLERYWRDVKTIETYVVPETAALTDMARHYFDLKRL